MKKKRKLADMLMCRLANIAVGRQVCKLACLLIALQFPLLLSATTYYSRTNLGNWNVNATWSTVAYGNATNTGTYPKAGDVANIGDGYTIYINSSVTCATLNVGQGVSGILEFKSTGAYILSVTGNLTVNTSAKLWYNTATAITHNCFVGGNFTNYGIVDFYVAAGKVVNLTFNGTTNSIVTGTGTWDLNIVTVNKSTSTAYTVDVLATNFEAAIKTFSGIYGTYIHDNATSYSINPATATFTIGPNVIFQVPQGTMSFAVAGTTLIVQGALYVNGGTVNVGSAAGTQGLQSDQNGAGIPYLEVSAGTLNVYGGITYGGGSALEPFSFKMTGGTINLNTGTTGTARQLFCVNDVANSVFNMSGGTIVIQKPNTTGSTVIDASVCGASGTVTSTGGTFQFGNASTPSGSIFSFKPFATVVYPNFKVTGTAAAVVTLRPSISSTADFKLLSLYIDVNKFFDIRSISGTTGDTKQMTLMSTSNGVDALVNNGTYTARQSTVTFNVIGAQAINGTAVTTFYNLAINNASGITLNKAANVSNFLSMVNGKLFTTNVNILTCMANANASLGSASSYVDGPMVHTVASSIATSKTFPIGKTSVWRAVVLTVTHSNATSVTYRSEVFNSPASSLPYTLPPSIQNVSAIRYTKFIRQAVGNFVSGTIQMYYGSDDLVLDYASLKVAQDNGVNQWVNVGGTATANITGNIVSSSFNFFNNYFALANPPGGNNPLPVTLSAFNANLVQGSGPDMSIGATVDVNWTTQAEINNDHFVVERSADNNSFAEVATVAGHGNSTVTQKYFIVDESPLKGISYYRLTQVDYDGKQTTSHSVMVKNIGAGLEIFPNVSDGSKIHLKYTAADMQDYQISVQTMEGKTIAATLTPTPDGVDLSVNQSSIAGGGVYFVTAYNGSDLLREKLILVKN